MDSVAFTGMMWYWAAGILLGFLPLELFAAIKTPGKSDTFSEFVWWVFGVRRRIDKPVVKWARFRRFVLAGLCVSLTFHFVFAFTYIPIAIFGAPAGAIILYAFVKERR